MLQNWVVNTNTQQLPHHNNLHTCTLYQFIHVGRETLEYESNGIRTFQEMGTVLLVVQKGSRSERDIERDFVACSPLLTEAEEWECCHSDQGYWPERQRRVP